MPFPLGCHTLLGTDYLCLRTECPFISSAFAPDFLVRKLRFLIYIFFMFILYPFNTSPINDGTMMLLTMRQIRLPILVAFNPLSLSD